MIDLTDVKALETKRNHRYVIEINMFIKTNTSYNSQLFFIFVVF